MYPGSPTNPDRQAWVRSYAKEKQGLLDHGVHEKINAEQYKALRKSGALRAIPTMCCITLKKDAEMKPHRAKSRIVVLGNQEDRFFEKSKCFAPVLSSDSLRLPPTPNVPRR